MSEELKSPRPELKIEELLREYDRAVEERYFASAMKVERKIIEEFEARNRRIAELEAAIRKLLE